jgi:hypothetical protein
MSKATFTFGRFNPPTEIGHGKLVSAVQSHAEESGGKHYIFPSHTQDKKKNPLTHDEKVGAMRKLFPSANVVSHDKVKTAIDAMKHLEKKGHTDVTMVVGSDRVAEFHGLLSKYRKKEYPGIKRVRVISAGHRDPDAEGAEGESASRHRELVAAGKRDEFISKYSDKKLGAHIHDKVKAGMQMESVSPVGIFLIGGPGSGKDYVLSNIFSRFDLTEVQIDHVLNGAADELIEQKKNIIINGSIDEEKIFVVSSILEDYDIDYVYVSVTNKVSRLRNGLRENPLAENKRIEKWLRAEKLAESLDCFKFNNSINLNESSDFEKVFFADQIEKLLSRLLEHGLQMQEIAEAKTFAPVSKHKSGLPKKYVAGLSDSTAKARKAHWKKMSRYSDKDPRAYKPAPGDATAKTKLSKYTKKYHAMYGESIESVSEAEDKPLPVKLRRAPRSGNITAVMDKRKETGRDEISEGKADKSLADKAEKSGVPLRILKAVYRRGVAAWNSGHRPGTTPSQWGHARVNSYITKGKTYHTADKDLREETKITGTNCKNCIHWVKESVKPVDKSELNENGGLKPTSDAYVAMAKHADLISLPGKASVKEKAFCNHEDIQDFVTERMCCAYWDNKDAERPFKGKADIMEESDINQLFEYQLVGTDEYRKHAIAMTPGQGEPVDAFPVKDPNKKPIAVKAKKGKSIVSQYTEHTECGTPNCCGECTSNESDVSGGNVRKFSEQKEKDGKEDGVDFTPTANVKKLKKGDRTPGNMRFSYLDGLPVVTARVTEEDEIDPSTMSSPPGFNYKSAKPLSKIKKLLTLKKEQVEQVELTLEEAVSYHLENKISFTENVFRPGSDMFFEMIKEAKHLYAEGKYQPKDEWEADMLKTEIGEKVVFEGQEVILDYPFEEQLNEADDPTDGKGIGKPWREGGGGAVYVRDGGSIRKIRFSQSGMKKRYMDPAATRSFVARHHCLSNKDKTSASYWACRWPRFFSNSGKVWW